MGLLRGDIVPPQTAFKAGNRGLDTLELAIECDVE